MIGPFGYSTDISRTWLCPDAKPTQEQKTIYQLSPELLIELLEALGAGARLAAKGS